MQLSHEQLAIIGSKGNIVVNSGAGCAKTTTAVEYARQRPGQKILYIAFNKSVRLEGEKRFLKAGVSNVKIETAHSLAYRGMNVRDRYTLCNGGNMKANEVADLCGIKSTTAGGIKHLILARHILNCLNLYLNSDIRKFADVDYLSICSEGPSLDFAMERYDAIYESTKSLLLRMYKAEIPVSHDAYLKFYSLSEPVLPYSHVLFDEGQDGSPAMLDIFRKQAGVKVLIGDSQQSIYAFRHAIDSLSSMDDSFERFTLSQSFRFPQHVADLAMRILSLKKLIGKYDDTVRLIGSGTTSDRNTTAVLSRSNVGLLDRAIGLMVENRNIRMHFEGDLSSYVYGQEGASLYDILYLFLHRPEKISNPLIKGFKEFSGLEEYAKQSGDNEMAMMAEIVKKYGADLFTLIRELKTVQTTKSTSDIVLSTCHKAKGQEFDSVELLPGFINEERIKKLLSAAAKPAEKGKVEIPLDAEALNQEINLLYVGLTRTRYHHLVGFDIDDGPSLYPTAINPKDFHFGNKTETLIGGPKEKKGRKDRTAPPEEHDLFSPMGLRAAGAH